jgi:biotin carboxyl carrier protein
MKMQFVVRAPRDVVVRAVPAAAGSPVDIGAVLVEFAP